MMLVENEYFKITQQAQRLFIQVFKLGMSIRDFQAVINQYPRITVTKFLALKQALESATNNNIEFGELKPLVTLIISPDNLEAKIVINVTKDQFYSEEESIKNEVFNALREKGITFGILYDVINKDLRPLKEIVVARALLPVNGEDARINYLELPDLKPTINDDGTANYYDMNLFRQIHKDDWIGEKILATPGLEGKNIKGEILPAKKGKDRVLRFDEETVETVEENNKIVLKAKCSGALQILKGVIGVNPLLEIDGNVGYNTGNINFDGSVIVYGTVEDGFCVTAEKDISILSNMGMGSVEKIVSHSGNIFIKGGISGKGKSVIQAGKSIFVKYANDCILKAQDSINVGFYVLNSELQADTILVQAHNARTIGGIIHARTKVSLRMVGNTFEKETFIKVDGFNRRAIKKELDELMTLYKQLISKSEGIERELHVYETSLTHFGKIKNEDDYLKLKCVHQEVLEKIFVLEQKRQILFNILSSRGEGEVAIYEKAYPKTFLEIKNIKKNIKEEITGTFYAENNELKFV
jgi:uncharacterized protein (DUF342 family)